MYYTALDHVPLWVIFVAGLAAAWLALDGGYRFGQRRLKKITHEKENSVGAMVGAILGLLAFMLAFTFGLAANRFESRRQTVLEEANAIGTTYLRTRMLPEPHGAEAAKLLREYVDVRVRGVQEGKVAEAVAESEELQERLWTEAVKAAEKNPSSIMTGLFVQSLNEVIDVHAKRILIGARSRIPLVIWLCLIGLAALGMTSVGYQAGLSGTKRSPAMLVMVLAFAGVLGLIADLDRGHEGLLTVSQQALLDLQKSMQPKKP